jgi:hypothetical protein
LPAVPVELADLCVRLLVQHFGLEGGAEKAVEKRLAGLFLEAVPPQLSERMRERLRKAAGQEALQDTMIGRQWGRVLAALANRGLTPVPLKGRALALAVWPRPALRPPGDIDLLLEADAIPVAADALRGLGYRSAPQERAGLLRAGPVGIEQLHSDPERPMVDLHARLFRSVGRGVEAEALLARSRPSRLDGHPIRELDPADRLLFLCVHAAKHGLCELKWLLDLYALARSTEAALWRIAARRAIDTRAARPFFAALSVLQTLPSCPISGDVIESVRPGPLTRRALGWQFGLGRAVSGKPLGRFDRYAIEIVLDPSVAARARMALGMGERLLTALVRS